MISDLAPSSVLFLGRTVVILPPLAPIDLYATVVEDPMQTASIANWRLFCESSLI